MKTYAIAICAALCASPSLGDVRVQFLEGAPKDRFIFTNLGTCDLGGLALTIDFAQTDAGLIFDVTETGAGVEVFQPFEVTEGAALLTSQPAISDGDQTATLTLKSLGAGERIAFTIDVDDTAGTREITVSGGEMDGATVSLTKDGEEISAFLGANAETVLKIDDCAL